MITITNKIDMYPGGLPVVIHLSQYDSDFTLVFELYSSAGTFTVQSGTTAIIRGTKTDGNGYDATATISGNTVTVTGDEQMTAAAGFNGFELVLTKDDKDLSTANFVLDVEKAAMDAETITSESVLMELNAIIAGAATATQAATDAAASAAAAAASAQTLVIDDTLTQSGQAADAKKTGDEIADVKADLEQIEPGLSDAAKLALLDCFAHVAWIDEHGQDYYDALEAALYEGEYPMITATFTPGTHVVYTDDALSTLTPYLVVKYFEDVEDSGTTILSTDYTLSGTLTEGQSVIRVSYDNLSTTFTLIVVDFYNQDTITTGIGTYGNIYKNSALNVLMSDTTVLYRATVGLDRGRQPIYKKNPYEALHYPIPVPADSTQVTITCDQGIIPNVGRYQWENTAYGNPILDSGWLDSGGGTVTYSAMDNTFFTVVFKKTDGTNFSSSDLPNNVFIQFT